MNIFEGARRVTKITAALIAFGFIFYGAVNSPTMYATYNIAFGKSPALTDEGCPSDSQSEHIYRKTSNDTNVSLTLCFLAEDFPGDRRLIPFKYGKEGGMYGHEKYATDVNKYTKSISDSFVILKGDEEKLDKQWWSKRFSDLGANLGWMLFNLALLFGFTWAIGWIARGFMGIPQGLDKKPDA